MLITFSHYTVLIDTCDKVKGVLHTVPIGFNVKITWPISILALAHCCQPLISLLLSHCCWWYSVCLGRPAGSLNFHKVKVTVIVTLKLSIWTVTCNFPRHSFTFITKSISHLLAKEPVNMSIKGWGGENSRNLDAFVHFINYVDKLEPSG